MAPNPRGAIVFSVQAEAVHANVRPAEGYLDRVVEIAQRAIAAHPELSREQRADAASPEVELVDLNAALGFHNTVKGSGKWHSATAGSC